MREEEFKTLRTKVLRKSGLVNMSLRKKINYRDALKINEITEEELNLMGYEYNQDLNVVERIKYVTFEEIQNTYTNRTEIEVLEDVGQWGTNVGQLENNLLDTIEPELKDIMENHKIIMKMVELFKNNKLDFMFKNDIVIELPFEDDKQFKASYRVNKTINKRFKEFCKNNEEFTQKDLLSQALKEFMDKYD